MCAARKIVLQLIKGYNYAGRLCKGALFFVACKNLRRHCKSVCDSRRAVSRRRFPFILLQL